MSEAEEAWIEHMKSCGSCKADGKWNNKGGTTNSYHAFIIGYDIAFHKLKNKQ